MTSRNPAVENVNSVYLKKSEFVIPPAFPAGTTMLFQQTTAPTGWTKQTTHNNKALRVVTGTAGSGGSNTFTGAFNTSFATSGGAVSNHTLTTAQIPSHTHGWQYWSAPMSNGYVGAVPPGNGVNYGYTSQTNGAGGGGAHNHGLTQPSFNLNVQYVDIIIATKD
jgi:hypothetical protein